MGLGFGEQGSLGFPNLINSCVEQATIGQNIVGFYIGKPPNVAPPAQSFLDVGYVFSSWYSGPLRNLSVENVTLGRWAIAFDSYQTVDVDVNLTTVNSNITFALNSPFNLMPNRSSVLDLFQRIFPEVNYVNSTLGGLNLLNINCGTTPTANLTYTMDGQSFQFGDLSLMASINGLCYFAFASPSSTSTSTTALVGAEYSLGYLFLYEYYLLFDYEKKHASLGVMA